MLKTVALHIMLPLLVYFLEKIPFFNFILNRFCVKLKRENLLSVSQVVKLDPMFRDTFL